MLDMRRTCLRSSRTFRSDGVEQGGSQTANRYPTSRAPQVTAKLGNNLGRHAGHAADVFEVEQNFQIGWCRARRIADGKSLPDLPSAAGDGKARQQSRPPCWTCGGRV